jgi:zinc protease
MFNEMEGCPYGEYDRRLEEAGAENNAATWLDWTQYTIAAPANQLALVVELEALRMSRLVLMDRQVDSEKEVVANERRFRVEDDVEGSVSELLWASAFDKHPYRWPTIGWMEDIEGFTTEDCREFYRTFYAPNNATLVVVGDVAERDLLSRVIAAYGPQPAAILPPEDIWPEPVRSEERRLEVTKPTPTEKVLIGYRGPAIGDADHVEAGLLGEVLFGGRASRLHRVLVRERELASEVRVFVGPFRDPGLIEVFANARRGHTAEELLAAIDQQLDLVLAEPVDEEELERARARTELSLLAGLETVDGKASTIGFYDTLLGRPAAAFERLEAMGSVTPADLRRVARRYLARAGRTVVIVRAGQDHPASEPHDTVGDATP